MPEKIRCRVLTGPTGVGKTELALRIAEEFRWDIICMDSMQIYRRMDIGTAKPTREEQARVPHHMIDIIEPEASFSVSQYRDMAETIIRELADRGREALFVGGTGLYLEAMIHPMAMGQTPANPERREELKRLAETGEGKAALHRILETLDPQTAGRLPLNDIRRTIRAIEVTESTGIPFSQQPVREDNSPFDWTVVSLTMERERLYGRINERVTRMIGSGLKEEVAGLLRDGVPEDAQSMSGIGYRQMIPCVKGEATTEETAEEIRLASRHYAKRQMTFLRRIPEVIYLDAEDPETEKKMKEAMS